MKALDIHVAAKAMSSPEFIYEDDFKSSATIDDVLWEFGLNEEEYKVIIANGGLACRNDRIAQFDQYAEGRVIIALA